jgi:hypothetical protein
MANAKVEIKFGGFSFSGEGEQEWLSSELQKVIGEIEKIAKVAASIHQDSGIELKPSSENSSGIGRKTLPAFLNEKSAANKQNTKFLATAIWLGSKGKVSLTTADITKALKDTQQGRLGNPAECLNQNVKKGFCEKDGSGFYVTAEGKKSLGIT